MACDDGMHHIITAISDKLDKHWDRSTVSITFISKRNVRGGEPPSPAPYSYEGGQGLTYAGEATDETGLPGRGNAP